MSVPTMFLATPISVFAIDHHPNMTNNRTANLQKDMSMSAHSPTSRSEASSSKSSRRPPMVHGSDPDFFQVARRLHLSRQQRLPGSS